MWEEYGGGKQPGFNFFLTSAARLISFAGHFILFMRRARERQNLLPTSWTTAFSLLLLLEDTLVSSCMSTLVSRHTPWKLGAFCLMLIVLSGASVRLRADLGMCIMSAVWFGGYRSSYNRPRTLFRWPGRVRE